MYTATDLAEKYRIKLGLLPWEEYEKQRLRELSTDSSKTLEIKAAEIYAKRQCGSTTKLLLKALAMAEMTESTLYVAGNSSGHTDILTDRAKDLADKLGLQVEIRKGDWRKALSKPPGTIQDLSKYKLEELTYIDHYRGVA